MITSILTDNVTQGLGSQRQRVHAALVKGVTAAGIGIQADVVQNYLHGQVLHQRSGNLARNIIGPENGYSITDDGKTITATVGIGSTAWYGKLHEFGGTFVGQRKLKKSSRLVTRRLGERVMTGSPYGIHFPERSFIRASLTANEASGKIRAWVEGLLAESLQ